MNKVLPLKRFGQNYLQDQNIVKKIISEIDPKENEFILEIGPGQGALTKHLFESKASFSAIEIDKRVIDDLKNRFTNLNLIQADFLDLDFNSFIKNENQKLRVVGNIPYNITSPILFKLFENNKIITDAVFMVQYEVAKRMAARMGTKEYGILAVLLNYFGKTKLAFKVSPNVFYPKPNVHSAVIHIYFNDERNDAQFNTMFKSIVKSSFGNRRKTLKNSLSNGIFAEVDFSNCGIDLSLRAEQLTIDDFIKLAEFTINKKI
ncbi:MAG: 16S rRNA (adenine(1518)-N(6)/adenine(1519)-N(6))-dimethyltransferase RsmA [Ignavibacteriaceae bacterium]|nr:16S rRNA (adenine(1518)-N(6)/adenine(1519)-N(6))-dimethyltransferase RsmA [Ignavibacterium sp.]MCC6254835.1 16S rRNA (adenine(1518)-N(6)/adenine(1519)-N(6))-dimethyltransferase RsmA [Ignavibacteriaceae bacterium]HRN24996.1 16S rRNA (adenine(1518)-N(6)/adenine(1519)-N(6))-dimethyltransferase RsmA [Ignavibacteriaceae bacterium]HRP94161.1 16S rRNA (adenine(1518)-N(6)/adenine(1519)-N(6))-dimethyltransferase RsmA [Ignavibacteriaceae bacterium]HRQ52624.1 16S rRNA (adenine(1518)-N(6)/adenine(1519)-